MLLTPRLRRRSRALLPSAALVAVSLLASPSARADDAKAVCTRAYDATQAERTSGMISAARKDAALCTDVACPDLIRRDCGKWLEQLDAAQPSLVLRARRGGRDVAAVEVDLDGKRWLDRLDGRATPIDPGQHALRFSSDGMTLERAVLVVEGERNRLVEIELPGAPAPVSGERTSGPWIVGGAGVALLAAGGVMTAVLVHEKSVNDMKCTTATCFSDAQSAADVGKVLGPITTASFVAGGVGVAAGALWLLASRRRHPTSVGIAPVLTSRSRGLAVQVGF